MNKDRVELFAAALESDGFYQCKGHLKMRGLALPDTRVRELHCALGVATQVALDNGLKQELNIPFPWIADDVWNQGVLHPAVVDWYGWSADNPPIPLKDSQGIGYEIASANDAGFSFWDIAQAVRAKWLKEEG